MTNTPILWKSDIERIKKSGYFKENISITDALIENFYQEIMGEEEKTLIELLMSENPSQLKLDEVIKKWDIEVKQNDKSLLLAYLIKTHPKLHATSYEEPRLKGLLSHQRFSNLKIIAHYTKIGKELNKHKIIPLIFKGGLMRFLNPDFPRYMGDIDIMVQKSEWRKSAKIAKSLGYWYKKSDVHSFDILENKDSEYGILDIHNFIYIGTRNEKKWIKSLFERAVEKNVYGVRALIPSYEDLMFITLLNLSSNLSGNKCRAGILYSIFDCKFLLENETNFDWNIVIEDAKTAGCEVQINLAAKFINKISNNILPKEFNNTIFEKETNDYSRMIMFTNFYYSELQEKCRAMKVQDVVKSPKRLGEYIKLKTKYKTLKMLNRHPRLIEIFIKDLIKIYKNKENINAI